VRVLFVHQNFPGQYRHLAAHFARRPDCEVVAIGEAKNLPGKARIPGVKLYGYEYREQPADPFTASVERAIARGRVVASAAAQLRRRGFRPDVILAHIGWGEALFLKDIFPGAKVLLYSEFFYRGHGADLGFDPEFPADATKVLRTRVMNAPLLMSLDASDWGVTPTRWQHSRFAPGQRARMSVIHDGIDTDRIGVSERNPSEQEELVTYVARNLEPYRGFHVFMRAIPEIQKRRPGARVVIVGGDGVSYSPRPPGGDTWRARLLRELDGKIDLSRVSFSGRIPYDEYLALLGRSSAHVYLTYPFVLSWSLLEAMAAGCLVVGSRTAPVQEVIEDGRNGLLADFLSPEAIAERVDAALSGRFHDLRRNARQTVRERFDLRRICLPAQAELVERLAGVERVPVDDRLLAVRAGRDEVDRNAA
jgi:glycosyltransferase involved in cell wall biosynthesis